MTRAYLDWNATAPLRPEARDAMQAAMDLVGNPSSVHAEGRAAKALVEKARAQVAALLHETLGLSDMSIVFTSGTTEAANHALLSHEGPIWWSAAEHDAVAEAAGLALHQSGQAGGALPVGMDGRVRALPVDGGDGPTLYALQAANSETGVIDPTASGLDPSAPIFADITQALGKRQCAPGELRLTWGAASAHKLGGPKGVGCLIHKEGVPPGTPLLTGGGQEMRQRAGTENVIGIAGFGAAAEAARRDLENGVWDRVAELRNILENALEAADSDITFVGRESARLPNTSCFAAPGWKGETQVMQMDLAGYAISAGAACSSGKVKESRVLRAMGFDTLTASSAIRVSLGPTTTEAEVLGFARSWTEHYRRWKARAA